MRWARIEGNLTIGFDVLIFLRRPHVESADDECSCRLVEGVAHRVVLQSSVGPECRQSTEPLALEVCDLRFAERHHCLHLPLMPIGCSTSKWRAEQDRATPIGEGARLREGSRT